MRKTFLYTTILLATAGCGGDSSSGGGNNVFNALTSALPISGANSQKVQQAQQAAKLGAKGVDLADLNSPRRQDEIGQSVAMAICAKYPLSTNQTLNDYVNLVGLTVASAAPNSDINYCFAVLDTADVGAYSAPGGYIFITRGAIEMMSDESELAGVLAHEVAHVALHHGIDAVKTAKTADLAASAAETYNKDAAIFSGQVDAAVDVIFVKGYSRGQESQADAQAVHYAAAAGYDPAGLLRFLQKLETLQGSGNGMKQLMSTHPGTPQRVAAVQDEIAQMHASGATLADRFAANVKMQ